MSNRHPKSRRERRALRSRLSEKFTDARERVARRVNRRGEQRMKEKANQWKPTPRNLAAE